MAPLPTLADRVARQRVASIARQLQLTRLPILVADALLTWLVGRHDLWVPALAWWATMEAVQQARRRAVRDMPHHDVGSAQDDLRRLVYWSAGVGVVRAVIVAIAFWGGDAETEILVTMVVLGLAAGAVATCGGEPRVMLAWGLPALGAVIAGWAAKATWEGVLIAVLTAYLLRVLAGYVRELGAQGEALLSYASKLEQERDRIRAANEALERAGEALRAERDRVTEASAAKSRVLASVSHDLRQPLFALSLNVSALGDVVRRVDDPYVERIESGMRRSLVQCRGLLDQLVDFSRLEAGHVDVRRQAVELGPLLAAIAPPFQAAAREAGLGWRLDTGGAPVEAWTDPVLLERIVGNLIGNAIKFTPRGEVGVQILPTGAPAERARLVVFDTGRGIPRAEHERVFEEFYQLDNPSRDRARGLGLGLSIVRRLAQLLDIDVLLDSDVGRGCRFTLALPTASAPSQGPPAGAVAAVAIDGAGASVLVIDDDPALLDDMTTLLAGRGWTVHTARDTTEALAVLRDRVRPDVVVTDFRLAAGVTGADAVRAVREAMGFAVPALIITGDTAPDRIVDVVATGLPVMHKPLDGDELVLALRQAVLEQMPKPAGDISG
ncbi:sensor histidine kinase [Azohydromonas sediminis]|uniref:ATP-binding response regulator n=1 Tax=Azohydromonas sediminis TaxID=2259674 RepID=UPI000E648E51|nr:HAMP domain-containing sensor histidine kinase [Azohydromonas sediminis]